MRVLTCFVTEWSYVSQSQKEDTRTGKERDPGANYCLSGDVGYKWRQLHKL